MLRVGNVIFLKIGQLCPKVKGTYTDACIYPVSLSHHTPVVIVRLLLTSSTVYCVIGGVCMFQILLECQ